MELRLKHDLWNETRYLTLRLPDEWEVEVLRMGGSRKATLSEGDYRNALAPLAKTLRGAKEVCVLFDDLSRPTKAFEIAPFLLEVLEKCGIADEQVRFLCALGTHAPHDNSAFRKKLGDEVMERFAVFNHNPYENCRSLGTTSLGTPIMVNSEFLSCDVRIGIGSFIPHSFCGFGGGYKIVMPAVSHIDAIEYHHGKLLREHWDKAYAIGRHEGNPLLADLREYGRTAGLDAVINVFVNEEAEHTDIFAGNPDLLYGEWTGKALDHYATRAGEKGDIVFVNALSKANEAVIGLALAEEFLADEGGFIVVLCDIPGGQVVHYLLGRFGKSSWGRLAFGERVKSPKVRKIFFYSRVRDRANEWWFGGQGDVAWSSSLEEIISALEQEFRGRRVRVKVIPDGTIQMPAPMR